MTTLPDHPRDIQRELDALTEKRRREIRWIIQSCELIGNLTSTVGKLLEQIAMTETEVQAALARASQAITQEQQTVANLQNQLTTANQNAGNVSQATADAVTALNAQLDKWQATQTPAGTPSPTAPTTPEPAVAPPAVAQP